MAITIAGSSTGLAITTTPTLPVTTKAGDVIIISVGSANANWNAVTVSGAGATWIPLSNSASPYTYYNGNWFAIGYNCSAGQTSVTLTSNPSTTGGMVITVLSGAATTAPTKLFGPIQNTTAGAAATTSGLAWNAGQTLISFGESYTWSNTTSPVSTWAGTTATSVGVGASLRQGYIDYILSAPSTQTSATYTSPTPSGSTYAGVVYGYAFTPKSSSNFLAFC